MLFSAFDQESENEQDQQYGSEEEQVVREVRRYSFETGLVVFVIHDANLCGQGGPRHAGLAADRIC
jgi:hypothetical protein